MEVPMLGPKPVGCQTENWLLDPASYWRKVGVHLPSDLPSLVDPVKPLWVDGYSTYHGCNDRIPVKASGQITSSLRLISVNAVTLSDFAPGEAFGNSKRRVQGSFRHADQNYAFRITDPVCERHFLAKRDGTYRYGKRHLTVSIGEQFEDYICKFIAAIVKSDG